MSSYIAIKKMVDEKYGPGCQDCGKPAVTYYDETLNKKEPARKGRFNFEFYGRVVDQGFPATIVRVCRRCYLNRYQNDRNIQLRR